MSYGQDGFLGADKNFSCGATASISLAPNPGDPCCPAIGVVYCWTSIPMNSGFLGATNTSTVNVSPGVTTTYTLTVTSSTGVTSDEVIVSVPTDNDIGMDVYKPAVIAGNTTTLLADNQDAMTFENFDNDDNDAFFDYLDVPGAGGGVIGGDDELIRVTLKVNSGSVVPTIQFDAINGSNTAVGGAVYSRIWLSSDKTGGEYILGDNMTLNDVQGGFHTRDIWIEGVRNHISQRHTQFILSYAPPGEVCSVTSIMALTIIGLTSNPAIEPFQWTGVGNGFGPPNHMSNALDVDPKFPVGEMNADGSNLTGFRVFSGSRNPANAARNNVTVTVSLSVLPIEPITMYVKAFDIDDPYTYPAAPLPPGTVANFIDPNDAGGMGVYAGTGGPGVGIPWTSEDDNRGSVTDGGKYGAFPDDPDNNDVLEISFALGQIAHDISFNTSTHPGDNYRLAISADEDFLGQLRNTDQTDGFQIVSEFNNDEVPFGGRYLSPILSVWRILHLENDSMGPYVWGGNIQQRLGLINDFSSTPLGGAPPPVTEGTNIRKFEVVQSFSNWGAAQFDDDSPNLDNMANPLATGRFENGEVRLDVGGIIFPAPSVHGNGDNRIEFSAAQSIAGLTCTVTDIAGGNLFNSTVVNVIRNGPGDYSWTINIPPGVIIGDYNNGNLNVAGGGDVMITVPPGSVNVVESANFQLAGTFRDDDGLGATLPNQATLVNMNIFEDAYLITELDGGDAVANNENNLNFIQNIFTNHLVDVPLINAQIQPLRDHIDSNESNNFWVVHLVTCWQSDHELDGDPNAETTSYGLGDGYLDLAFPWVDNTEIAQGPATTMIFRETVNDNIPYPEGLLIAHEIGHQFGLSHGNFPVATTIPEYIADEMGIMRDDGINPAFTDFIPRHINLIRVSALPFTPHLSSTSQATTHPIASSIDWVSAPIHPLTIQRGLRHFFGRT